MNRALAVLLSLSISCSAGAAEIAKGLTPSLTPVSPAPAPVSGPSLDAAPATLDAGRLPLDASHAALPRATALELPAAQAAEAPIASKPLLPLIQARGDEAEAQAEPARVSEAVAAVFEASNLDRFAAGTAASSVFVPTAGGLSPLERAVKNVSLQDPPQSPKPPQKKGDALRAFGWGLLASAAFVGLEWLGTRFSDSVSLRADVVHTGADWAIDAASWLVLLAASRSKSPKLKKLEPVVGLITAGLIAFVGYDLAREALERFGEPQASAGLAAAGFALFGVAANLARAVALFKHRKDGVALGGVFLHALTDVAGSLVVAGAGLAAYLTGAKWLDPVATALVVLLIAHVSWKLGKKSIDALRGKTPPPSAHEHHDLFGRSH
jgi:cation diffusion facilitator family transporter